MAKRFKLRISRVIPSFQSCRSKDPSTLPTNPVPSFLRPSPLVNQHFPATTTLPSPLPSKAYHYSSSIKRHVSFCGFRYRPTLSDDDRTRSPPDPKKFEWERQDKWHVVAKAYDISPRRKIYTSSASPDSDVDDDVSRALPPSAGDQKKKRRVKNKKKRHTTSRIRFSTSSFETGIFSSEGGGGGGFDDGEETETLVSTRSSKSFSTDSSPQIRRRKKRSTVKKKKRGVSTTESESVAAPARLSVFQRLIPCRVEGKMRESFAVVKKSEDPYEDFKRSMLEMILEKQIFNERELEQLLHCFLSLNSKEHHRVIIEAFAEIWEALFCCTTSARSSGARVSRAL